MPAQTYLPLNPTGDKMPTVGFGCWKVGKEEAEETIYQAIKHGYRLIDGACDYGNEVEVGKGINRAISEGIVQRKDLFVVTKLWNTFHNKANVRPAFDRQLKDLNLSYVDLYLVHFPIPLQHVDFSVAYPPGWSLPGQTSGELAFERSPIQDCWRELEKLVEAGLVRNIGISNFNVQSILDLLTYTNIKPSVLQIELHPYLQQTRLVEWVQKQGIQVTAYTSLGPASFSELTDYAKNTPPLLSHDTITSIASKHNVTPAQVLLRWSVERGCAVIPKSTNIERIRSNFDLFSFQLDAADLKEIAALDCGIRFNDPATYGLGLPLFD